MTEDDFKRIESMIVRHVGVREENILHKLDLVVEGQQMLADRMDRMEDELRGDIGKLDVRLTRVEAKVDLLEKRIDGIEKKVDAVASDLQAHRADTEAHRRGYRVREE